MSWILHSATEKAGEGLWKWSVWVETDASEAIEEVVYILDPSYSNPVRRVKDRDSRFRIEDIASSSFTLFARVKLLDGLDLTMDTRIEIANEGSAPANAGRERPIILLVEDDRSVLDALLGDLKRYGRAFALKRADSGIEALDILRVVRESHNSVALIISDERMPGMRGMELMSMAAQLHPNAKKMLLTAYLDAEVAISGINVCRIDYYLSKPWDPPEEKLYPVIDRLLSAWQPSRNS